MSLQVDPGTVTLPEAPRDHEAEGGRPMVTVVIPVYFAEATIGRLVEAVIEAFVAHYGLQVVLVNDGSTDGTHDECRRLVGDHPDVVTYVRLARNFGEHNAVMAGLHRAEGEYVVIMDDDFQNHPEDAVRLVAEADTGGFDIVYSRYPKRRHSLPRVLGSKFNGWVANFMMDKPPDLYLSSFKCMRQWLVQQVLSYQGPFPYLDGLALRCTQSIGRVTVEQGERAAGQSGYTSRKLMRLWGNMFVNFSVMPLRASTALGAFFVLVAVILSGVVLFETLSGRPLPSGWPFLAIVVMFFSGGQLLMLGIIGEYLGRLFLTANRTPQFVVREESGRSVEDRLKSDRRGSDR
jgi:undecaprenyl-phosphate 4-deoxy-4-formamido-L-arabinose transferase